MKKIGRPVGTMNGFELRRVRVRDLRGAEAAYNPRKISDKALAGLKTSVKEFGLPQPIIYNKRTGNLVGGHQRLKTLGPKDETDIVVVDLPLDREKALNVTLNNPHIMGEWSDKLAEVLADIDEGFAESLNLTDLQLDIPEVEVKLSETDDEEQSADLKEPMEPPADPVSEPAKVYQLGPHRVVCGDCRSRESWELLLGGKKRVRPVLAFTSPPYADRRVYDEDSEFKPIPPDKYVEWFKKVAKRVEENLAANGSFFVNIKEHCEEGERHEYVYELVLAMKREWGWKWIDTLCWERVALPGLFGPRFKNEWEPVYHFSRTLKPKFRPAHVVDKDADLSGAREYAGMATNLQMGKGYTGKAVNADGESIGNATVKSKNYEGALPGNVLSLNRQVGDKNAGHPAVFPLALPEFFVKAYTDRKDAVVDPFMGSGTTLVACDMLDRVAYGFELSPGYMDVIRKRWGDYARAKGIEPGPDAL